MKGGVNYPPTAEPVGWASGVIDSPNGNASSRFFLCPTASQNQARPLYPVLRCSLPHWGPEVTPIHFLIRYISRIAVL